MHLCIWESRDFVAHGSNVPTRIRGMGNSLLIVLCNVLNFPLSHVDMTNVLGRKVVRCLCPVLLTRLVPPNMRTWGTEVAFLTLVSILPIVLTRENGLGRELLIIRITILVLFILLSADPNVLISRAGS